MSEAEKLQREKYQLKRKKLILIQQIVLIVLTVVMVFSSIVYFKLDKNTYVYYTEEGNAIHKAYLSENEFYDESYLNGSHAYIASLIEKMTADFSYKLSFDTNSVKYKYNYHIDAQLEVLDRSSKAPLYNPTYEIVPLTSASGEGNSFTINKHVEIDFQKYSEHAHAFLTEYNLKDTSSSLIVRMYVNVVGECETFVTDHSNEYVTELRIPLCIPTFKPVVTTTIPAGEQKILAINNNVKTVFCALAISFLVLDILVLGFFIFFVISTRDKHIDYSRRVLRILKNYRSYIQKINNAFDMEGYQILYPNEFIEMLEIRDTLQKPILMHENDDKTCAQFFIVADFHIIYLYEIKVEDDDERKQDNNENHKPEITPNPKVEQKLESNLKCESTPEINQDLESNLETESTPEINQKLESNTESEPTPEINQELESNLESEPTPEINQKLESNLESEPTPEINQELESNLESDPTPEMEEKTERNFKSDSNKVDVVDVKFAKTEQNYKFDPNGEELNKGDIVLVHTTNTYLKRRRSNGTNSYLKREQKKATVTVGNYKVDPSSLSYPLKKIIRVLKRAEKPNHSISNGDNEERNNQRKEDDAR